MSKHITFLRAINVGGHTVKMNALRDVNTVRKLAEKYRFVG